MHMQVTNLKTSIISITPGNPRMEKLLKPAADTLRSGGLVAFPTETVYGLGAVLDNEVALSEIFKVKGRPNDNPLILHIWHINQLEGITPTVNPRYQKLIERFWPGPLTLIFPKKPEVSSLVTAGLPTVAVRMPSHPVAKELLRQTNLPVAAPSANLSGKPSPTRGEHVILDLNGKIPLIIDAGNCSNGIESTVLIALDGKPMILRPGSITREMLEDTLSEKVELVSLKAVDKPQAPGMKYRHYAPKAPVTLVEGDIGKVVATINQLVDEAPDESKTVVIGFSDSISQYRSDVVLDLGPRNQPEVAAARLYDLLRHCDDIGAGCIFIEGLAKTGVGAAVENRLQKASGGNILYVS